MSENNDKQRKMDGESERIHHSTNNKSCFDFSIDNLLKSEMTRKRKCPEMICYPNYYYYQHLHQFSPQPLQDHAKPVSSQKQKEEIDEQDIDIEESNKNKNNNNLSWLNCTRFNPPKVTRSRKRTVVGGGVPERRPGRGPRIPFSPGQIVILEQTFDTSRYLSSDCITRLATTLNLSNERVKIWFQNRRARMKRERAAGLLMQDQLPHKNNNNATNHSYHHLLHPSLIEGSSNFSIYHNIMHI